MKINWGDMKSVDVNVRSLQCGHCAATIAPHLGYHGKVDEVSDDPGRALIVPCPKCTWPSLLVVSERRRVMRLQFPPPKLGQSVEDISDTDVKALYEEARQATSCGCYTAAVLCCRKLLMHIAVGRGAGPGLRFIDYVEFLRDRHFIPPGAEQWVDLIREVGNEANHEIHLMLRTDADDLLKFVEMLLRMTYEFPATVKRRAAEKSQ